MSSLPEEHCTLRIVPTVRDTNAAGDIFGGWLMSQADIAGSIVARQQTPGRVVTVAVDEFHFIRPVLLGDVVSIYGRILTFGTSSLTVELEIYIERKPDKHSITMKVAQGRFVYVHLDRQGKPTAIK